MYCLSYLHINVVYIVAIQLFKNPHLNSETLKLQFLCLLYIKYNDR